MIPVLIILMLVTSIVSVRVGYKLGNKHLHHTNEILHTLKNQIRQQLFTRQNWTSKEVFGLIKFMIVEFENKKQLVEDNPLKPKSAGKKITKFNYPVYEN